MTKPKKQAAEHPVDEQSARTDIGIPHLQAEQMRQEIEKIFESHKLKVTPARLLSIMWSSDSF
ncbi:hypothetical protein NK8_84860 (plasmid) [Caballeronia sp. NK8]|nr:hypothetical protein NK8_84860 [Caballeronia sp. NK8]